MMKNTFRRLLMRTALRRGLTSIWLLYLSLLGAAPPSASARPQSVKADAATTKKVPPTPTQLPPAPDAWPAAPESESALLKRRPVAGEPPLLKIEAPVPEPPQDDLLEELAPDSGPLRGKLVYAALLKHADNPSSQWYFVLRGVGLKKTLEGQPTAVSSYHMNAYGIVMEPQFSADGKKLLFKVGWPFDTTGTYELYLWDMAAGQLRGLGIGSSYYDVFWSPDNNYIAYVHGGDRTGKVWGMLGNLQLRIKDLNSGKERRIVKNNGVTGMSWTRQGTLLFTMEPEDPKIKEKSKKEDREMPSLAAQGEEPEAPLVPSIYEVSAKGGAVKKIIENGYQPEPSPDGRWIAFFGKPVTPQGDNPAAPARALYLFDRKSGERFLVGEQDQPFARSTAMTDQVPALLWSPDSQTLIALSTLGGAEQDEAYINAVDPQTRKIKRIAVLTTQRFSPAFNMAYFAPLKFSRDGRFLFVNATAVTSNNGAFKAKRKSLEAVRLSDGSITTVMRIDDPYERVLGWDWYDETGTVVTDITPFSIRGKKQ